MKLRARAEAPVVLDLGGIDLSTPILAPSEAAPAIGETITVPRPRLAPPPGALVLPAPGEVRPIVDRVAPDPFLLVEGGRGAGHPPLVLLYATQNFDHVEEARGQPILPIWASTGGGAFGPLELRDPKTGTTRPAAIFDDLGTHPWASSSPHWWAPEVWPVAPVPNTVAAHGAALGEVQLPRYLALYSARDARGDLAIGAATSRRPWGGFRDLGAPLIEADTHDGRGVIDATYVPELGAVAWKFDGNHVVEREGVPTKLPTPIYLQRLVVDDARVALAGERVTLFQNDQPWEDDLVEGPAFHRRQGRTFCFYSGNCYLDERYAMGYAWTDGDPLDPRSRWHKHDGPFIHSETPAINAAGLAGPGHCMVHPIGDRDELLVVFHAWPRWALSQPDAGEQRRPFALRLGFDANNHPRILEP